MWEQHSKKVWNGKWEFKPRNVPLVEPCMLQVIPTAVEGVLKGYIVPAWVTDSNHFIFLKLDIQISKVCQLQIKHYVFENKFLKFLSI